MTSDYLFARAASGLQRRKAHTNDDIRFEATYAVTEPSGNFAPNCVSGGTLRITTMNGSTVLEAVTQCPSSQPSNNFPYVYDEARLPDVSASNSLRAEFRLTYDEGVYGVARGSGSIMFAVLKPATLDHAAPSSTLRRVP